MDAGTDLNKKKIFQFAWATADAKPTQIIGSVG